MADLPHAFREVDRLLKEDDALRAKGERRMAKRKDVNVCQEFPALAAEWEEWQKTVDEGNVIVDGEPAYVSWSAKHELLYWRARACLAEARLTWGAGA